jgi:hypothetical protein
MLTAALVAAAAVSGAAVDTGMDTAAVEGCENAVISLTSCLVDMYFLSCWRK